MSFKNQSVFSSVFTNTTFTITEEMQISEVSIEVVSGTATLLGGLQIPGLVNIPVSLDFNQPVVLKANKGYTLSDITIDSTAGGVFEIIGIYGYNDGVDPAAEAYFTATGITGATQQAAIDNLVKSLKGYGLWTKMKAIYPFVTDNRNLASYTEDFSNAFWAKNNATITSNSIIAPNGTLTADSLVDNTTNAVHSFARQFTLTNDTYTLSIYCKKGNRDWAWIALYDGTNSRFGYFNLATGTIGTVDSGATATITDSGNGWYRCTLSMPMTTSVDNYVNFGSTTANNVPTYIGNNTVANYYWGAQLELGSTATTYQPILTTQQSYISAQFKYNLKDPRDLDSAFRLVFSGGWTFSTTGALPNGTNGYADTKLVPSSVLTVNNTHLSFYSRTSAILNNQRDIAVFVNGNAPCMSLGTNTGVQLSDSYDFNTNRISASIANALGFVNGIRTSSTVHKLFKNGAQIGSTDIVTNILTLPNQPIYLGAANITPEPTLVTGYSTKQTAFSSIGEGLSDTEAANLYIAVQTYQEALSRQVGVPVVSDPNAQAFIDAAQITDVTQADAINNLVLGLKYNGLWSKMKAVYPFVGGTATTHKFNLMNPVDSDAAYRLVFNGGWTHSTNGATPNGTNGYANTYLTPSSALTTSSAHFSKYNRTNDLSGIKVDGCANTSPDNFLQHNYTGANAIIGQSLTSLASYTATDTRGLFNATRTATNSINVFRNSTNIATNTGIISALPNTSVFIGARNDGSGTVFYNSYQAAFASIGDGLTDADALNLYTIVQAYQTALGRQV